MPYIAMIETFRTLNPSLIITGAPQCPTSDAWFDMKEMVQKAAFDALFVQFYNNPSCDATESSDILSLLSGGFNFNEWEDVLDSSDMSKDAKIFIGLPASSSAAQSGYISPEELKALVCEYKDKEHFGGISLWDLTRGAANVIEGKTYNEYALEILQHGCDTPPTSTPTTSPTSKPSTSSITSSSSSSSSSTSSPSSSPHTASSSSTSATPTAADSTSRASGTSTSTSIRSSSSSRFWSNSTMTTRTSDKPTTSKTSGLLITTKTSGGSITTVTSSSAQMTTRTEYTTTTRTVTECPPHVDCPKNGYVTTEVIPTYTTVCPVTKTDDESLPETTEGLGDSEATKATSELANPTDVPGDDECEDEPPEEDDPLEPNESTGDDECEDDSSKTDEFTDGVHPTAPCDGDCEPTGGVQPPVPCEGDCPGATETKVIETVLTTITVGGSSIIKTVTQPKTYGPKPPVATPIPTGGWTSSPGNPSATETVPFEAGSSELTVGMTALAAMLAIQAILL